jgi:hypothetical protein
VIAGSKPVMISQGQLGVAAIFGVHAAQPVVFSMAATNVSSLQPSINLSPRTLLSLGCALTV